MTSQVGLPIAINEPLAPNFRLEPITFDLVCRRMELGREALEKQVLPASLKTTPTDTPVTPTGRFTSDVSRIASTAPERETGRDIGQIARQRLIEQLKTNRDTLLDAVAHFRRGAPKRVQCEMGASVFHFRLYDVLTGGDGTDRRSTGEIAWERWYREATTESEAQWIMDRKVSDASTRMRPLYWLGVSFDDWEETY